MTPEQTKALIEQWDRDAAEDATSAANIVSHDGYYELDIDAVAQAFARHRLAAERRGMEKAAEIAFARAKALNDAKRTSWALAYDIGATIRKEASNLTGEQAHDPS